MNVGKKIRLISEKAKNHACEYFKTMTKSIDPIFYVKVVIERAAVKIAEFKDISL